MDLISEVGSGQEELKLLKVKFDIDTEDESEYNDDEKLYLRNLFLLFDELRSLAVGNIQYFDGAGGAANERLYAAFCRLFEHLEQGVESGVEFLLRAAPMFDYDRTQPGNGYRSMVTIVHKCCLRICILARYILVNRESYLFRTEHYSHELDSYVTCLGQLRACLFYLQKLVLYCPDGVLVPNEDILPSDEYEIAERLMKEVESLSQEAFYGRCLGFQYCQSMKRPLTVINLAMASYGDGYGHSSGLMKMAASVLSGSKYFINPELRAKQVVTMTRSGDIQLCKAFWSLGENVVMHKVPLYMCPTVEVDKVITIGLETVNMSMVNRGGVLVVNSLPDPVNVRLLSARLRTGQETLWKLFGCRPPSNEALPTSNCLIIHCHGGGFVAQSSASHQVYLRHWASELDCPILSVDYSLAPERRFPCQLNEVFYAYCWAILNSHLLGTTAERVCIVGDSAGANLAVAVSLKALVSGIRQPDGILSIYGCLLMKYTPSPSRILALMDPLLPIGLLSLCLHAYADESTEVKEMQVNVGNSRSIQKTVSAAALDDCDSRTGAGIDRSIRTAGSRYNDSHQLSQNGFNDLPGNTIPQTLTDKLSSTEAADTQCRTYIWRKRHEHLLAKSCSMPVFNSTPHGVTKTSGSTLDKELFHLSSFAKMRHFDASPLDNFKNGHFPQSPFVSPLLADDNLLKSLCPVHLMACHLDPMLDDTVMFARRLHNIGKPVKVEFITDLPHGFLNFVLVSPEAKLGSERCIHNLKHLLGMLNE